MAQDDLKSGDDNSTRRRLITSNSWHIGPYANRNLQYGISRFSSWAWYSDARTLTRGFYITVLTMVRSYITNGTLLYHCTQYHRVHSPTGSSSCCPSPLFSIFFSPSTFFFTREIFPLAFFLLWNFPLGFFSFLESGMVLRCHFPGAASTMKKS